jgi:hypothetical protein
MAQTGVTSIIKVTLSVGFVPRNPFMFNIFNFFTEIKLPNDKCCIIFISDLLIKKFHFNERFIPVNNFRQKVQ